MKAPIQRGSVKNGNFKTRDFSPLIESVLASVTWAMFMHTKEDILVDITSVQVRFVVDTVVNHYCIYYEYYVQFCLS